ncbi:MAG: hypothetical protein MJY56_00145 [Bacteroidales bacterium]|nr:hypothetical protein [Bacteroidales bacterium]
MKRQYLFLLSALLICIGCSPETRPGGNDSGKIADGNWPSVVERENGHVTPYISRMPKYYWNVTGCIFTSTQNDKGCASSTGTGFRNHVLFQSLVGLAHRALERGESDIALWAGSGAEQYGYKNVHEWLDGEGVESLGTINPQQLALLGENEKGSLRKFIDGYVLTDVRNNSECVSVATVASHVYNAIIVDVDDEEIFKAAGFRMLYDAREKKLADSWAEFKDKCANNALVMIPVWMGELRGYAIEHGLFCFNVLKEKEESGGNNLTLFREVNTWLQPNSPIYGASNYDEGNTAFIISKYGNNWVPYDWGYNTGITSLCYPDRREGIAQNTFNPAVIDWSVNDTKNFVNFYLSDGDNVQWEMNDFGSGYWLKNPYNVKTKMSFGLSMGQLSQIAPSYLSELLTSINSRTNHIFDRGSYYFIDYLGRGKNREEVLWQMAKETAHQMKETNTRVLATVSWEDCHSKASVQGYQAMVDANDELDGIFTIAYSPYAKSSEEIIWVTNRKGIDIPVIRTTYSIWNTGSSNHQDEGSPTYIAHRLNKHNQQFNLVCVHCWSDFADTGTSDDETSENRGGTLRSAGAVDSCIRRLDDTYKVVTLNELIWRIRMKYRPEQTKKVLGLD